MKAYEHLDQFKGDSKFYTWIVRIAVNQALMKLRRRKTDKSVSLDEQIDTGEDTIVREIAAWDEDPEQQFSRDESARFWTQQLKVSSLLIDPFSSSATSKKCRPKRRQRRWVFPYRL